MTQSYKQTIIVYSSFPLPPLLPSLSLLIPPTLLTPLLLLFFIQHVLTYEVQEATEINSLMRANTAITRMMTNYCR